MRVIEAQVKAEQVINEALARFERETGRFVEELRIEEIDVTTLVERRRLKVVHIELSKDGA